MTESAIDLVKRAFRHFDAGRIDETFALLDPAVVVDPAFREGRFQGRDTVRRLFETSRRPYGGWRAKNVKFESVAGDRVLVTGRLEHPSSLGALYILPVAWIAEVEDDLIVRVEGHVGRRQALKALEGCSAPGGAAPSSPVPG